MYEQRFDDGTGINVDAANGHVSVYQHSGSSSQRGASFLTPDQADELADGIKAAAAEARGESSETAAAETSEGGADGEAPQEAAPAS